MKDNCSVCGTQFDYSKGIYAYYNFDVKDFVCKCCMQKLEQTPEKLEERKKFEEQIELAKIEKKERQKRIQNTLETLRNSKAGTFFSVENRIHKTKIKKLANGLFNLYEGKNKILNKVQAKTICNWIFDED